MSGKVEQSRPDGGGQSPAGAGRTPHTAHSPAHTKAQQSKSDVISTSQIPVVSVPLEPLSDVAETHMTHSPHQRGSQQSPDIDIRQAEVRINARREDIRSYRALIVSALVSAFTVPLASLAVQKMESFGFWWASLVIALWSAIAAVLLWKSLLPWLRLEDPEAEIDRLIQLASIARQRDDESCVNESMEQAELVSQRWKSTMKDASGWAVLVLVFSFITAVLEFGILTLGQSSPTISSNKAEELKVITSNPSKDVPSKKK